MKKVLLFLAPLFVAVTIFFIILFFLNNKSGKGALQVTSVPKSAVYLDEKLIGTTPLCACELPQMIDVGDYTIKLVPSEGGFRPFEEKIIINKGTLTVVDRTFADSGSSDASVISLSPLSGKKDIEILVISLPDKANVFLDNNPVGITPLLLKNVSESDHDLRITRDGYKDKSLKIKTALGFKLSSLIFLGVNPDLSEQAPVASISAEPTPTIDLPTVLILNTPTGSLNVRESSSISSAKVGEVKPGESYELIEEVQGWFKIKLSDDEIGWISSSYAVKE
ncbi:MAG: PEGA domain-containing protein [Candidatus Levybacteria bacterium]|nr:PEGA domain-containing protein [Candidatus Levybacteria bacterium]